MSTTRLTLALALSLFLSGCATGSGPDTSDAAPPPSLHTQLAQPVRLTVDPVASRGAITAREHIGLDWEPARIELAIDSGELVVERLGETELALRALEVDIAPIALPMLPGDAHLTGVTVQLPAPATLGVTWQDADAALAVASLDLDLAWSLSASGGTLRLATQRLAAVPVAITLERDGGGATATLGLDQPGELWTWADLLALDDLALELPARTASPVFE